MRIYMTEVGTVLNLQAFWSRFVSHVAFLQLNFTLPQTTCSFAVQKMWLKIFFQSITLLSRPFLARSSWGSSPHFSQSLYYSVPESSWALLRFPADETHDNSRVDNQQCCYFLCSGKLWITEELSEPHHTAVKIYCWHILEKVVFQYHENSSELRSF